jgi:hypothetical protein
LWGFCHLGFGEKVSVLVFAFRFFAMTRTRSSVTCKSIVAMPGKTTDDKGAKGLFQGSGGDSKPLN